MRLLLVDRLTPQRRNFYPLALARPIWELRCGMSTLGEKLVARAGLAEVACFVPDYLAEVYRRQTSRVVNDPHSLAGDDLLVVDTRLKTAGLPTRAGPSQVALSSAGEVLWARILKSDLPRLETGSIEALLESAARVLPSAPHPPPATWNYIWDLRSPTRPNWSTTFARPAAAASRGRWKSRLPCAARGDVYVAPGARIHPLVVLDAEHGPIYIDQQAEIHPFTRIEGPCYVGPRSILLGAKCREGNSIGPQCRVGGEVEESIFQGYSNKYHDGFLGHAYVGEWVNLGALTQAMRMYEGWGARLLVQNIIEKVTGSLNRAEAVAQRLREGSGSPGDWELLGQRLAALQCLVRGVDDNVEYQAQLDRVKALERSPIRTRCWARRAAGTAPT